MPSVVEIAGLTAPAWYGGRPLRGWTLDQNTKNCNVVRSRRGFPSGGTEWPYFHTPGIVSPIVARPTVGRAGQERRVRPCGSRTLPVRITIPSMPDQNAIARTIGMPTSIHIVNQPSTQTSS